MQNIRIITWHKTVLKLVFVTGIFCAFAVPCFGQVGKGGVYKGEEEEKEEAAQKKPGEEGEVISREAQKALFQAQELMKTEDYTKARKILLDFLATKPESIPIVFYHMLGYTHSVQGNMEEARKVFKEGYEADPTDEALLLNYAVATWETERFAEAAALFEKVYSTSKEKESRYLQQAAVAWIQAEKLLDAKRVLKQLLSLPENPKPEWYQLIISTCMELEQMDEAEGYIRQYLDIDPLKEDYWGLLAQIMLSKEDYRSAAAALEISYMIKPPKEDKNWEDLADIYTYLNAPLKAAQSLEMASKNNRQEKSQLQLVETYIRAQRFDKAISSVDRIIASQGATTDLLMKKGNILYDSGRIKAAIDVWDECIKKDPKFGRCQILKAFALWDIEDWDGARKVFEQVKKNEEYRFQAEDALAVLDDLEKAKYDPDVDFRKGR